MDFYSLISACIFFILFKPLEILRKKLLERKKVEEQEGMNGENT